MFLIDSALASDDWDGMLDNIKNLLQRYGAEIETIKKWDSRRLAYKVKGKTHGTYILTYFRIDGTNISAIERDVRLSENILRTMIPRTDKMTQEDIEKLTPAGRIEKREKELAEKAAKPKAPEAEAVSDQDPQPAETQQPQQSETEEPEKELDEKDAGSKAPEIEAVTDEDLQPAETEQPKQSETEEADAEETNLEVPQPDQKETQPDEEEKTS
jgi:small subunit ribosomal protein S6